MDRDRRRRRPGVGLCDGSEAAIRDTLAFIESRVRELEAEARRLRTLRCELAEKTRDYERGEPGTGNHEFLALNLAVRRECLRILRRLAAKGQPGESCVVVVEIPVFVRPLPSKN
jgi:hypothetical protein